jgi:succinate dehydrogenase / fumarate reductase flavoprotein subunit
LQKEISKGSVKMHTRCELIDVVTIDGRARGIITRNLVSGEIERHVGDAVVLATGGYGNVFYLSTNAMNCNASAAWRACKKGALFANPCFTQIHPTCIPVHGDYQSKLTLMSESLRNDGRIWVPKKKSDSRPASEIPEDERDYYLERKYPSFGNLVPRDLASRNAKEICDAGYGVGPTGDAVYLDFSEAIGRLGRDAIEARYGNLFEMYNRITDDNPYETPMMIYPAVHYTMGGLWVDYNLMTTVPGLYAIGEANFSDHGANRLGASALMQGLADGYFVLPNTVNNYLADLERDSVDVSHPAFVKAEQTASAKLDKLLAIKGTRTVDDFHRELGLLMWNECGMARSEAGLKKALEELPKLRDAFWSDVNVPGSGDDLNQALEKANRVADFLEFAEFMLRDALDRAESCGGHFRLESQTEEGEALRDDEAFAYVSAWEFKGVGEEPVLHKEPLVFEEVPLSQRSYK